MPTVLVTGASGFLASYVIDQFLQAGYLVKGYVLSALIASAAEVAMGLTGQ